MANEIVWNLAALEVNMQYFFLKGRVRIRKSKSGEKWNEQFVNNAYVVLLYRCCTSKICSCRCQILDHGCALKREKWASWAFLPILMHFRDFKWIFHYQRTPALVILFQHINKYGKLLERKKYLVAGCALYEKRKITVFWRNMWKPLILSNTEFFSTTKNKNI